MSENSIIRKLHEGEYYGAGGALKLYPVSYSKAKTAADAVDIIRKFPAQSPNQDLENTLEFYIGKRGGPIGTLEEIRDKLKVVLFDLIYKWGRLRVRYENGEFKPIQFAAEFRKE